jgi:hypothetical protein
MRRHLLFVAALVVAQGSHAWAVPCSGFLADINSSGGCTIGDKLFSAFAVETVNTAGGAVLTVNNVLVSSPPDEVYSLTFNTLGGFNAASGILDFIVRYTVATTSGLDLIQGLTLSIGDVTLENLTGPPTATVNAQEFVCLGVGVSITGSPGNYACSNENAGVLLNATPNNPGHTTFAPTAAVSVAKRLSVDAGVGTFVSVSAITNDVSQIPEPSTYASFGAGLLAVVVIARMRRTTCESR